MPAPTALTAADKFVCCITVLELLGEGTGRFPPPLTAVVVDPHVIHGVQASALSASR